MARPHKNNANYHSHDSDMRNDPKIRALRRKFGHEGYAVFNMILEVLTNSDNFKFDWNQTAITLLEGDFDTDKLEEIVNYCISPLGLLASDNSQIFSYRHIERLEPLLRKRKRQNSGVIASENTQSKVKEIKVNKIKKEKKEKSEIFGINFSEDLQRVIFPDGSEQELGKYRKLLLKEGNLQPNSIRKGDIDQ